MNIKLILYGILLAVLLSAGLYVRHKFQVADQVPELQKRIVALEQEKKAEVARADEAIERAQKSMELQNDLQKEIDRARNRNAALSQRVRVLARPVVSEDRPAPAEPDGAGGSGSGSGGSNDVTGDFQRFLDACQRDSIKLRFWQQWWEEAVPAELK